MTDALTVLESERNKIYESILDIGCGSGEITLTMSALFPEAKIVCIEPDESMIEKANSLFNNKANVSVAQQNAQSFKVDKKFDLFTAFHVLHWIPKDQQQQTLRNANTIN